MRDKNIDYVDSVRDIGYQIPYLPYKHKDLTPKEKVEEVMGKVWAPSDKRPFTLEQFRNRLTYPKLGNKLSPSQPRQEMSQL